MDSWPTIGASILIAAIAAIPGILSYRNQRRQADADAGESLTSAALSLVNPLRAEVIELRQRMTEQETLLANQRTDLDRLQRKCVEWTVGIRRLVHQIRASGQTPVWEPEEDNGHST